MQESFQRLICWRMTPAEPPLLHGCYCQRVAIPDGPNKLLTSFSETDRLMRAEEQLRRSYSSLNAETISDIRRPEHEHSCPGGLHLP